MINTNAELKSFTQTLETAPWIAMDTEADSLHAYPPKLCLMQFGVPEGNFLIDPLAGLHLDWLFEALHGKELIFHAADYDLRLMFQAYGFVPSSIFDTMLAAKLLGKPELGLSGLVGRMLSVILAKSSQKANWAIRPLTRKMEDYARNDTRYLKPLADLLREELKQARRLSWHREYCERFIQEACRVSNENTEDLWRIKGSARLDRHGLAVLKAIFYWREEEAILSSRPPFFMLQHDHCLDIASQATQPGSVQSLKYPSYLTPRRKHGLQRVIEKAVRIPEAQWPHRLRQQGRKPTMREQLLARELLAERDRQAERIQLDAAVILPRSMAVRMAMNWEEGTNGLMKWQLKLLRKVKPPVD